MEDATTGQIINVVEPQWTGGLFLEALAGAVTLVAVFTQKQRRYTLILGMAVLLTLAAMIIEIVLFTSVEKVTPLFRNQQVTTAPGPGPARPGNADGSAVRRRPIAKADGSRPGSRPLSS